MFEITRKFGDTFAKERADRFYQLQDSYESFVKLIDKEKTVLFHGKSYKVKLGDTRFILTGIKGQKQIAHLAKFDGIEQQFGKDDFAYLDMEMKNIIEASGLAETMPRLFHNAPMKMMAYCYDKTSLELKYQLAFAKLTNEQISELYVALCPKNEILTMNLNNNHQLDVLLDDYLCIKNAATDVKVKLKPFEILYNLDDEADMLKHNQSAEQQALKQVMTKWFGRDWIADKARYEAACSAIFKPKAKQVENENEDSL